MNLEATRQGETSKPGEDKPRPYYARRTGTKRPSIVGATLVVALEVGPPRHSSPLSPLRVHFPARAPLERQLKRGEMRKGKDGNYCCHNEGNNQ